MKIDTQVKICKVDNGYILRLYAKAKRHTYGQEPSKSETLVFRDFKTAISAMEDHFNENTPTSFDELRRRDED